MCHNMHVLSRQSRLLMGHKIYATSEERKQRNRQAQAAFRERRTEYIKQLEATIKQNEETLSTLQQSHRSAADECLMLRYKNSLLERILLEKGQSDRCYAFCTDTDTLHRHRRSGRAVDEDGQSNLPARLHAAHTHSANQSSAATCCSPTPSCETFRSSHHPQAPAWSEPTRVDFPQLFATGSAHAVVSCLVA